MRGARRKHGGLSCLISTGPSCYSTAHSSDFICIFLSNATMIGFFSLILGLGLGLVVFIVVHSVLSASRNANQPPRPPGPKGLPFVGNLNDLPKPGVLEAHHWLKHKELYGSFQ